MLKSVLFAACLAAPAFSFATTITLRTVDGKSAQVTLDEIEAGVLRAASAGGLVAADSTLPNADGSFSITRPRILADGKMARISPGGAGSDSMRVCVYFGFKKAVGNGYYEPVQRGEPVADVTTDGTVSLGSHLGAISQMNCK